MSLQRDSAGATWAWVLSHRADALGSQTVEVSGESEEQAGSRKGKSDAGQLADWKQTEKESGRELPGIQDQELPKMGLLF